MKQKLKDTIKIILILGLSIVTITLLHVWECKTRAPDDIAIVPQDTIVVSEFFNLKAEEGLQDALEYYDLHHTDIVYAQAILETGYFKSNLCTEHNNLFGLYNSKTKKYYRFDHWTDGVIAYKDWIQRRYKHPEDYYKFLSRIHYAEDSTYILKLKQIVRKENDKRRYVKGDTISQRK